MSGITQSDNTISILLSGSDSYIHGLGTAHFLRRGVNEQGVRIGFDLPSVFWGKPQDNDTITGSLKLTIMVLGYTADTKTLPLTFTKQ